jgi:hypothetical protein
MSVYNLGDTKEVEIEGYGTHSVRIANTSTPTECSTIGFSQSACGVVIEFTGILARYTMNITNTSVGGWPASGMYKFVNGTDDTTYSAYVANSSVTSSVKSIYMSLPEELRNVIIDTTVISGRGSGNSTNFTSSDKLYLLDSKEVYGTTWTHGNDTAKEYERQLDYYLNQKVTTSSYSAAIKKYNNNAYYLWLRSASTNNNYSFFAVNGNGSWNNNNNANHINGVSLAFKVG